MVSEEHAENRPPEDATRVLDPERDGAALKALTHPLRIQLLGMLRESGAATASELAARTGESSASTSYHLRVLAKHAFIMEAEHRDGRERRWRAVHSITSWSNQGLEATASGRAFVTVVRGQQLQHLKKSLARHEADIAGGRLGPQWLEPSRVSDLMPLLTTESLTELWQAFDAKLTELTARDEGDPQAARVVLFTAGLPVAPLNSASEDKSSTAGEDQS
ncbi:ArsR/SmtB family transcription factor [Streptomyces sp. NPDC051561]|uniref:ArsR/SmtB family transcription factor n=1 Tax=Streptomyces sp. NPDC051561 TaxID=3365658 RepID=UPI0037B61ED9